MLDNDSTTFYTSGIAQKANDWIGVDLRDVRDVTEISILQGRNSKDDVDYFDHAIVECSADGKTWKALTGELDKQYIIHWQGAPEKSTLRTPETTGLQTHQLCVCPLVRRQPATSGKHGILT